MIRPVGNKVIVRPDEAEKRTAGGIILPDKAQEKPCTGEVVAVGSGEYLANGTLVAPEVTVGDKVIFSKYGSTEITVDNENYLVITPEYILGII